VPVGIQEVDIYKEIQEVLARAIEVLLNN